MEHRLRAEVINRHGTVLATLDNTFRVSDAGLFPHEVQQVPLVLSITGVRARTWGTHQVRLYLDDDLVRALTLYVVPAAAPQAAVRAEPTQSRVADDEGTAGAFPIDPPAIEDDEPTPEPPSSEGEVEAPASPRRRGRGGGRPPRTGPVGRGRPAHRRGCGARTGARTGPGAGAGAGLRPRSRARPRPRARPRARPGPGARPRRRAVARAGAVAVAHGHDRRSHRRAGAGAAGLRLRRGRPRRRSRPAPDRGPRRPGAEPVLVPVPLRGRPVALAGHRVSLRCRRRRPGLRPRSAWPPRWRPAARGGA